MAYFKRNHVRLTKCNSITDLLTRKAFSINKSALGASVFENLFSVLDDSLIQDKVKNLPDLLPSRTSCAAFEPLVLSRTCKGEGTQNAISASIVREG